MYIYYISSKAGVQQEQYTYIHTYTHTHKRRRSKAGVKQEYINIYISLKQQLNIYGAVKQE